MLFILFIFSLIQQLSSVHVMKSYGIELEKKKCYLVLFSIFHIVWILFAGKFSFLMPIVFAGVYLLQFLFVLLINHFEARTYRYMMMVDTFFSAGYLISYGIIKIYFAVEHIPEHPDTLNFSALFGAEIILLLTSLLPWSRMIFQKKSEDEDDRRKTLYSNIIACLLLYVFVDGCLSLYGLKGIYIPLMLISGNLLILFLYMLFIRQEYLVDESQYLEEERRKVIAKTALKEYNANLQKIAMEKDHLTGAYSRRFAVEQIKKMILDDVFFSVAYIDLDGLKQINDTYGHASGDAYLQSFVTELASRLSSKDIVARLGGDEFLVILPEQSLEISAERMTRIRGELSTLSTEFGSILFSFGIVAGSKDINETILLADREMYLDKRRARKGVGQ